VRVSVFEHRELQSRDAADEQSAIFALRSLDHPLAFAVPADATT
jgi:hypothetical protein